MCLSLFDRASCSLSIIKATTSLYSNPVGLGASKIAFLPTLNLIITNNNIKPCSDIQIITTCLLSYAEGKKYLHRRVIFKVSFSFHLATSWKQQESYPHSLICNMLPLTDHPLLLQIDNPGTNSIRFWHTLSNQPTLVLRRPLIHTNTTSEQLPLVCWPY